MGHRRGVCPSAGVRAAPASRALRVRTGLVDM